MQYQSTMTNFESYHSEALLYICGILILSVLLALGMKALKPKNHQKNMEQYEMLKKLYVSGRIDKNDFDLQKRGYKNRSNYKILTRN
jgi:hypothetical protein